MKIAILSCFYPYRGGISQFNASLLGELGKTHTVKAFNFKRQYPGFLFPGKTQYVTDDDDAVPVEAEALLDTVNPFSWGRTVRAVRQWHPDLLLVSWWMSWFGPSLGYVTRHMHPSCKVVGILHNVIPHEPRFFDKPLTRYFLSGCDGAAVLSEEVGRDLTALRKDLRKTELFHPIYDHFGERVDPAEARRKLGLDPGKKTLLFFGLIRAYKGLDILLEAFARLDDGYQLVVAGEPYGSFDRYQALVDSHPNKERIHLFTRYIPDTEVKDFFCAADVTVLPYRSATQSGISAVSYHFEVPMIVTDVGGLKESVGDLGTGLVADAPTADDIARQIRLFFSDDSIARGCRIAIRGEKAKLSWYNFGRLLTDFAKDL